MTETKNVASSVFEEAWEGFKGVDNCFSQLCLTYLIK